MPSQPFHPMPRARCLRRVLRGVWLAVLAVCVPARLCSQAPAYRTPGAPMLGAAWYPEQWPEARWEKDLALMEEAHFTVVRIGEFAWSTMEPAENHYEFGWLDRAIASAERHHLAVVLGTPTDAPPAWLTQKYPETLRVAENGTRDQHGMRRQFNYASPLYRRLCARIVRRMALRYGHNAAVIGWQIGNEYTDESFDPATRRMFQEFLRHRYRSLDRLNARWPAPCCAQTVTRWDQIALPTGGGSPGLLLEQKHFVTATWRSFQGNQIGVLRPLVNRRQFVTTNIGGLGWSDHWDHYAISDDLNLASWDDYVGSGHLDATKNAMLDDLARGWKRANFWIMETQPGFVNWSTLNNALEPGETSAVAWQGVGHGADAILYWQWGTALNGQEQYHGSLVGPDGAPRPLYPEIVQLGADFARVRRALSGTAPRARIAILDTYDSRWAIESQPSSREYDQEKILTQFYKPLERWAETQGEAVDVVDPTRGSLEGYDLLVAPSLHVIDDKLARKLIAWVRAGGTLLLGPRAGMNGDDDAVAGHGQAGGLERAVGARVEQGYALEHEVGLASRPDETGHAGVWAEAMQPTNSECQVVWTYTQAGGWLDGKAAMVRRRQGAGTIAYLGTLPDEATLEAMLHPLLSGLDAVPLLLGSLPEEVEVDVRRPDDRRHPVVVILNHAAVTRVVRLRGRFRDLLTHAALAVQDDTVVTLPAQAVAVLQAVHP